MTVRKAKSKRALLLKNAFIDVSSPCESYAIIIPVVTISLFYYKFPTLFREPMGSGFGPSGRPGEDAGGHLDTVEKNISSRANSICRKGHLCVKGFIIFYTCMWIFHAESTILRRRRL
jgi:hypothetical protein